MLMEQFHACALVCQVTNIFNSANACGRTHTHTPLSSLGLQTPAPHYKRAQQARGGEQEGNRSWRTRWWRKAKTWGAANARNIGILVDKEKEGDVSSEEGSGLRKTGNPTTWGDPKKKVDWSSQEGLQRRQQPDDWATVCFNYSVHNLFLPLFPGQDWCSVAVQQTSW